MRDNHISYEENVDSTWFQIWILFLVQVITLYEPQMKAIQIMSILQGSHMKQLGMVNWVKGILRTSG